VDSMAVRDLSNLVKADDVISTEHLVTLLVVVSKYSQKDWLSHYETLSSFVVCGELKQCQQFQVTCLMHC
jgi:V-type H+-transporting ATPase subunit C